MSTFKPSYGSSFTMFGATDLDSLASSSTWLAGRESNVRDNSSDLYADVLLAGRFKANNTAPTAGIIKVFVGTKLNDSDYPDVFDGTGSAETVTSNDIENSILRQVAGIVTDTTSNRIYEFSDISVASFFGFTMPKYWFVFVSHSMVQALNATASSGGQVWGTGVQYQSV